MNYIIMSLMSSKYMYYGQVGKLTNLVDNDNKELFVGDIVEVVTETLWHDDRKELGIIVENNNDFFIMGWAATDISEFKSVKLKTGHGALKNDNEVLEEWDFKLVSKDEFDKIFYDQLEKESFDELVKHIKSNISDPKDIKELKQALLYAMNTITERCK